MTSLCNIIADIKWRYGYNCLVCNMTLWLSNSFCELYLERIQDRRERYIIKYNRWMSDRWRWIMIDHITTYKGMCSRLIFSPFMNAMASQITSLTIVYPTVYSGAGQRTHQSSASLAFVRGTQSVNNAENVSIWWRHHATRLFIKVIKLRFISTFVLLNGM